MKTMPEFPELDLIDLKISGSGQIRMELEVESSGSGRIRVTNDKMIKMK